MYDPARPTLLAQSTIVGKQMYKSKAAERAETWRRHRVTKKVFDPPGMMWARARPFEDLGSDLLVGARDVRLSLARCT